MKGWWCRWPRWIIKENNDDEDSEEKSRRIVDSDHTPSAEEG